MRRVVANQLNVNDRKEQLLPPLGTGDVSRAKRGGQAVAVPVEEDEGVVANGLEVAIVGGLLLGAAHWTSPSCRSRDCSASLVSS